MNKVKINITIDEDIYTWLNEQRGMVPLSTYINFLLSERKEAEELVKNYKKDSVRLKTFIQKSLQRIKGGDRFLEILSKEYLEDL
jgi:predicted CopG family antitoxin